MSSRSLLKAALGGDAKAVLPLSELPWAQAKSAAKSLGPLFLGNRALLRVLDDLRRGHVTPAEVEKWARFVRRGYFGSPRGGTIFPISIRYEQTNEDAIVEVLARLAEIDDALMGGPVTDEELSQMEASLTTST